jgi:hypothetical protein
VWSAWGNRGRRKDVGVERPRTFLTLWRFGSYSTSGISYKVLFLFFIFLGHFGHFFWWWEVKRGERDSC